MQVFKLINLETSELVEKTEYTDGKKAAKVAAKLTARTGRKYQVRKVDPNEGDPNWREREQARFDSGEYIPLINILCTLQPEDFFGHVAKKNPRLVAYTKDEHKGRTDKQSLISVEAFIDLCIAAKREAFECDARQWMGISPNAAVNLEAYFDMIHGHGWKQMWVKQQIDASIQHTTSVQFIGPVTDPTDEEEVKRIADKIEDCYVNYQYDIRGLNASCMRMERDYYGHPVHPTATYASPDVAIACLINPEGKTLARALCWPARKIYSRVYADTNALDNALKALGYTRSGYYGSPSPSKSFEGARLRKIKSERGDFYIMPYIDGHHGVDDAGEWFTMGGDEYQCDRTDGRAYRNVEEGSFICESCEEECDEDDTTTVYLNASRSRSERWCQHCVNNHAFYCHGYEEYFSSNDVNYDEVDGQTYTMRYIENNANWCDYHEEYTFDTMYDVIINDDGDEQRWSYSACQDNAYEWQGQYYSEDVVAALPVTERYQKRVERRWINGHVGAISINAWFVDKLTPVPQYLIDNGEVDCYWGVDGVMYLRDYVDHHPMRERVPDVERLHLSAAHHFLLTPPVRTPDHVGWDEQQALRRILLAEHEAKQAAAARQMMDELEAVLQAAQ